MVNNDKYRGAAERMVNHRDPRESVIDFGSELLRLRAEYADLERRLLDHELSCKGLCKNGLYNLVTDHKELGKQLSDLLELASAPTEQLNEHPRISSGDNDDDDGTQLQTAIHSWEDYETLVNGVENSHQRTSDIIHSKRSTRISRGIVSASILAVGVSILSFSI